MKISNKPVLVLLACCFFCMGESIYNNNLKGLLSRNNRSHIVNSQLDPVEKCICYKKKPEAISLVDQLDKGNGLQRLVVYFYIDPHTNETTMYVPDVEKQANLMPDFSFEKGDYLQRVVNLTNENILENRNAVNIKKPKKVDHVTLLSVENQNNNKISDFEDFVVPKHVNKNKLVNMTMKIDANVSKSHRPLDTNVKDFTNFDSQNDLNNDDVSFDEWFNNQIKAVKMIPTYPNEIDIKPVRKQIRNSLTENGMMVSEGKLKDEEGNVLDMAKLQLRPILIGDSVRYDNFLQDQDKFSLSPDLPYLKSLLVTIKDPSKVLSIIPLGKMYLPKDAVEQLPHGLTQRKLTDKGTKFQIPEKLTEKANNVKPFTCTGDHCQLKKGNQIHRVRNIFSSALNRRKLNETESNQYGDFSIIANNLLKSDTDNKKNVIKNKIFYNNRRFLPSKKLTKNNKNDISDNSRELNKMFKTKSLNIPYLKGLIKKLDVDVNKKRIKPKPFAEISEEEAIDDLQEPGLDDEYPGFRIMGGHPALGSGVPINVRGRSGWDSDR